MITLNPLHSTQLNKTIKDQLLLHNLIGNLNSHIYETYYPHQATHLKTK